MQNPEQAEFFSEMPIPIEPSDAEAGPTPNDPPWNSLIAIMVWVFSVLLILILPALFLLPYLSSMGIRVSGNEGFKQFVTSDPTAVFLQLVSIIPAHIITLALCWLVVTKVRKYSFYRTLGFSLGRYRWWHFVFILVGVFASAIVIGSIFPERDNDMIRMLRSSQAAVYLLTILATFTAPFVEEVVYRGLLYSAFQRSFGPIAAVAIVTMMFAGVHFFQYWGSPGTLIMITLLSLVLTLIRKTSDNLLPCIVLHFLFNGLQSIVIIQESFNDATPVPEPAAMLFGFFC